MTLGQATFRFYGRLNDFLREDRRNLTFLYKFKGKPSIKHTIEAIGVPHPEVGCIQINNRKEDFSYLLNSNDSVQVHPSFDNPSAKKFFGDTAIISTPCFLLDNHLGKLAIYLRMMGFDVLYRNDYKDDELAEIAGKSERILLTRDRGLLKRSIIKFGYIVRSSLPRDQVMEVSKRYDLYVNAKPFHRCLQCNSIIKPVEKQLILNRLQPLTKQYYDEFKICNDCDQIYWKGSHYKRMSSMLDEIFKEIKSKVN